MVTELFDTQHQETASETSQQRTQETGWNITANRCKGRTCGCQITADQTD